MSLPSDLPQVPTASYSEPVIPRQKVRANPARASAASSVRSSAAPSVASSGASTPRSYVSSSSYGINRMEELMRAVEIFGNDARTEAPVLSPDAPILSEDPNPKKRSFMEVDETDLARGSAPKRAKFVESDDEDYHSGSDYQSESEDEVEIVERKRPTARRVVPPHALVPHIHPTAPGDRCGCPVIRNGKKSICNKWTEPGTNYCSNKTHRQHDPVLQARDNALGKDQANNRYIAMRDLKNRNHLVAVYHSQKNATRIDQSYLPDDFLRLLKH